MGRSWEEVFPREPVMRIVMFLFGFLLLIFFLFFFSVLYFLGEGEVGFVWIEKGRLILVVWETREKGKSEKVSK